MGAFNVKVSLTMNTKKCLFNWPSSYDLPNEFWNLLALYDWLPLIYHCLTQQLGKKKTLRGIFIVLPERDLARKPSNGWFSQSAMQTTAWHSVHTTAWHSVVKMHTLLSRPIISCLLRLPGSYPHHDSHGCKTIPNWELGVEFFFL